MLLSAPILNSALFVAIANQIDKQKMPIRVLSRRVGIKQCQLEKFLNKEELISYDSYMQLLKVLGLSFGRKGDSVAHRPPEEVHKLIAEVFEKKKYIRANVSYMLRIHSTTLWRFLSGRTRINLNHLGWLAGMCELTLLPYRASM